MDLSKLPKFSESPPPPPPPPKADGSLPPTSGIRVNTQVSRADLGMEVLIALVLGAIFLMQGAPFGAWLMAKMRGQPHATGVEWLDGTPVKFFDLQGGTAWLYLGEWVLGACLLLDAVLLIALLVIPRLGRGAIMLAMFLGAAGAAANVVAIVMQVRAGFTQPIMSLVCVFIGIVMVYAHGRHLVGQRELVNLQ